MKTIRFSVLLGVAAVSPFLSVLAQNENEDGEVFELSPFEVTSNDQGYLASQTLSGTRFATPLEDVAASVSVFTEEYINDLLVLNEEELVRYTLNQELDINDVELAGTIDVPYADATIDVRNIRVRGLEQTPGMNYFRRIYTGDSYNVGRYDESRGPNGILFGVGGAGGITNSTTIGASLAREYGRIRLVTETFGGYRAEFRYNQPIIKDRFAVFVAGVNQEFDGYKHWSWNDTSRFYGAAKLKVTDNISIRVNAETGTRNVSNENLGAIGSWGMMVWKDWSDAVGVENLVLAPRNANPTGAEQIYGVFNRTTNANGSNEIFTISTNDGGFWNAAGEFQTVEYGSSQVRGPDGWAPPDIIANGSAANQRLKIYREDIIDPKTSLTGPGQYRDEEFDQISAFMDFRATENLFFELAAHKSSLDIYAPTTQGFNWQVSVDPNTTRGVPNYANGSPNPGYGGENPFAGGYVIESNWNADIAEVEQETLRLTMSYSHDFADQGLDWLGSHNLAAMTQYSSYERYRSSMWFGFLGAPFSTNWNSGDNRLRLRYYFPLDDLRDNAESVYIPDMRDYLGQSIEYDGISYEIGLYNREPGPNPNSRRLDELTTYLGVLQSYFWNRRIVTTLGYRNDSQDGTQYGYYLDPMVGNIPDKSIIANQGTFDGETFTAGVVFKVLENQNSFLSGLDLVANYSSNIGIPDTQQSVLPNGGPPPPPDGTGQDFGIQFRLMDNKINGRFVFYNVNEDDLVDGSGGPSQDLERITDGLGNQLISQGIYTEDSWAAEMAARGMDLTWSGTTYDRESKGWEFSLTANPTRNWRLIFNASQVDRRQLDRNEDVAIAYGYISEPGPGDVPYEQYTNGIEFIDGNYRLVDSGAFTSEGWFSQLVELGQLIESEGENFETFPVWNGRSITRIIYDRLEGFNRNKRQNERRQGLRPYRVNLFTAYDFHEGWLDGFTIGGGFNWSDKAVIGTDPVTQNEVKGPDVWSTNMMIRYSFRKDQGMFAGDWDLQVNIDNVLNDHDPILQTPYLYFDDVYFFDLPGDWGPATSRVNIVKPISARFSVTYSF